MLDCSGERHAPEFEAVFEFGSALCAEPRSADLVAGPGVQYRGAFVDGLAGGSFSEKTRHAADLPAGGGRYSVFVWRQNGKRDVCFCGNFSASGWVGTT